MTAAAPSRLLLPLLFLGLDLLPLELFFWYGLAAARGRMGVVRRARVRATWHVYSETVDEP
jgi:hypothetical protein